VTRLLLNKRPQRRVEPFALPVDAASPAEEEAEVVPMRPGQAA
jgi:hypothetical protein